MKQKHAPLSDEWLHDVRARIARETAHMTSKEVVRAVHEGAEAARRRAAAYRRGRERKKAVRRRTRGSAA